MARYASKVVAQAQAWLGFNEYDGTHKQIIDVYNSHKPLARSYAVRYDDEWCATAVSAVAIKLGYTDIIPTECGCQQMIELFKKLNSWVEDESVTPKPGWIIFYDWQDNGSGDNKGYADHVGIVEKVENGVITLIEGNYSLSVKRRNLNVNAKYIRGYGVPKYDAETEEDSDEARYYIQIDATYNKKEAESVIAKLKNVGFSAIIKSDNIEEEVKPVEKTFNIGDKVKIEKNAPLYDSTFRFAPWVYNSTMYVRYISGSRVVVSTFKEGAITGAVDKKYLTKV